MINFAGFLKLNKMNREVSTGILVITMSIMTITGIIVITMSIMTILSVVDNKINSNRIIDEIRNNKCIDLEKQIEAITAKKNTLYLIALERGKKRPNRDYLDSLEVDYELR